MLLNDAQQLAIEGDGIQLVIAGPGSGKTLVITEKIKHLIAQGVPPENILALTFSEKAAREMSDRLERATNLAADPSGITISTFHSFCLGLLKDNIFESGMSHSSSLFTRAHQLVWGLRNIDKFNLEYTTLKSNHVNVIEKIIDGISTFRDELLTPKELENYLILKEEQKLPDDEGAYNDRLGDLLQVWNAYENYKRQERLHDYDDMLVGSVDLFYRHPAICQHYRERFKYFLVDEFQDVNYAQFSLIEQLKGDHLCADGDNPTVRTC